MLGCVHNISSWKEQREDIAIALYSRAKYFQGINVESIESCWPDEKSTNHIVSWSLAPRHRTGVKIVWRSYGLYIHHQPRTTPSTKRYRNNSSTTRYLCWGQGWSTKRQSGLPQIVLLLARANELMLFRVWFDNNFMRTITCELIVALR